MIPQYTLIRSKRKTLALQITAKGDIVVRAPMRIREWYIEKFINSKRAWIDRHTIRIKASRQETKNYTESEKKEMKKRLLTYIAKRVKEICDEKSITLPTSIKITSSERRWGSCSHKNRLCFSYRLAEYLPEILSSGDKRGIHPEDEENPPWGAKDMLIEEQIESILLHRADSSYRQNERVKFIDAIIIHELAHTREKNHQKPFWDLVYAWMPEYELITKPLN